MSEPRTIEELAKALSLSEKALDQRRRIIRMENPKNVEAGLLQWLRATYEANRDKVRLLGKQLGYAENFMGSLQIRGTDGEHEAEAVPEHVQAEYSRNGWDNFTVLNGEELAKKESRARAERLRQYEMELRKQGKSPAKHIAVIEQALEAMRQEAKAA